MRRLWEITVMRENHQPIVTRLYARNTISLIQQFTRKHPHLLEDSTTSIEWKEVMW